MTIHITLDLKTWGTELGCDIRSIGACVFDPVTGYVAGHNCKTDSRECPTFYIACDNPSTDAYDQAGNKWTEYEYPLHRDPRTVQWWSEQSDDAQGAFANPVDLRQALEQFATWLWNLSGCPNLAGEAMPADNIRLWSHGPQFDASNLAAAYKAVDLPVPWHYRAPRDTRTCFDMSGIDDHSAWLKQHPGPLGIPHHALDDAICQARAVCAAYDRIHNTVIGYDEGGITS